MGTFDIIYLSIVGFSVLLGLSFAVKIIYKIRNNSIDQFKQRQKSNRNKIRHGRYN